jgi:hypothetical protein
VTLFLSLTYLELAIMGDNVQKSLRVIFSRNGDKGGCNGCCE